jgi:hypothetical protein
VAEKTIKDWAKRLTLSRNTGLLVAPKKFKTIGCGCRPRRVTPGVKFQQFYLQHNHENGSLSCKYCGVEVARIPDGNRPAYELIWEYLKKQAWSARR